MSRKPAQWETVSKHSARIRVPFGWVYVVYARNKTTGYYTGSTNVGITSQFVFDPFYMWRIDEKQD